MTPQHVSSAGRGLRSLLREIGFILALAAAMGFLYNAFSPKKLALIRVAPAMTPASDSLLFGAPADMPVEIPAAPDTVIDSVTHQKVPVVAPLHERALRNPDQAATSANKPAEVTSGYTVVSLDQVKRIITERRGVILDARNPEEYAQGHLPGARNFPYLSIENHFEALMQIPQDTVVLVYCSNPECHLGRGLCDFMTQMEFKRVFLYEEGWDGWVKEKLPVEGGKP